MSQEPLNSNHPGENEELTEAELDALAGGTLNPLAIGSASFGHITDVVHKDSDNMFHSFDGIKGSSLAQDYSVHRPMNLSLAFP